MAKGGKREGAGRIKGTPNKATIEFKEALNKLLDIAAPDMVEWLEKIDDPFKRFEVLSKFAEFIYPKLARTEIKNPEGETFRTSSEISVSDKELIERALKNKGAK